MSSDEMFGNVYHFKCTNPKCNRILSKTFYDGIHKSEYIARNYRGECPKCGYEYEFYDNENIIPINPIPNIQINVAYSAEDIKRRQEEKDEKKKEEKSDITEEEIDEIIEKQRILLKEIYDNSINIKIRPLLKDDNIIMVYMNYVGTLSDAYPEWHFAAALSLLSILADRKIRMKLSIGEIFTNIWIIGLGDSTISRKTTAMTAADGIASLIGIKYKRLPDSFSPESFVEKMSDLSHSYLWIDEVGQLLKSTQKTYMEELVDIFCKLYDCGNFERMLRSSHKKNVKTNFLIEKTYLTQWLFTTPENFKANTTILDVISGWLVRYLYIYPEYSKEWKGFRKITDTDNKMLGDLILMLKQRIEFISKNKMIDMDLTTESWEFYENWSKKRENDILKYDDKIAKAIFGRLQIYALKMAMLFQFGEKKFKNIIDKKNLQESCRLIDEYFLPTAKKIIIEIGLDEEHNLIEKIISILKRSGGSITRRKLLQSLHKRLKDVEASLESLEESGEIKQFKSDKKNIIMLTTDEMDDSHKSLL